MYGSAESKTEHDSPNADLDTPLAISNNPIMSIDTPASDLAHDIDQALARAAKGERDPQRMGKAIDEMNRMREELRQRIGIVEVAVDLIRDARNQ